MRDLFVYARPRPNAGELDCFAAINEQHAIESVARVSGFDQQWNDEYHVRTDRSRVLFGTLLGDHANHRVKQALEHTPGVRIVERARAHPYAIERAVRANRLRAERISNGIDRGAARLS